MPHALLVNFENLGHTTKNTIFRLVKLLADQLHRILCFQDTQYVYFIHWGNKPPRINLHNRLL